MGIVLSNIIAIYRRELQSYFVSPLAYAIVGIFWFLAGLFFVIILQDIIQYIAILDSRNAQLGVPVPPIDVPYTFLQAFLERMEWLLLFILPILSMGLYSEERKRGTLELLATSPVTNWAVAVGKLLGVLTFFITMILPLLILEAIVLSAANPPMSPVIPLLGHLALILLAGAVLSIGMFISSLTDSTILSAVISFAVIFLLLFIDLIAKNVGGLFGEFLGNLSLLKHYNTLIQGVFDTSSVILFISYIILGIFLTAQSINAFRFQRR
ncbi:MAG: ABC transporter permease [Cyanobacteria bacterium P01_A01_bin.84]